MVLSPRPLGGPVPEADDAKRSWERRSMDGAEVVVMYFKPGSVSSVSLLELGLYAGSGKLVVCCTPGYRRYDAVRHTCGLAGVPVFRSFTGAVFYVASVMRGVAPPGPLMNPLASAEVLEWDPGLAARGLGALRGSVVFRVARELRPFSYYSFRTPGVSGDMVKLRTHRAVALLGSLERGDGFFVLSGGRAYVFVLDRLLESLEFRFELG
jgi:hypothetical protein